MIRRKKKKKKICSWPDLKLAHSAAPRAAGSSGGQALKVHAVGSSHGQLDVSVG